MSDRPLLGSLHAARRLRTRSAAVLLCNPLGAEAMQAHRLYRVLAEQLEQAGFTVLRFDYSGTGDSAGSADDATVAAWLSDIRTAAEELGRAAPGTRLVMAGLRLGGTLAALASTRLELRARQLVLWDPVIDGSRYVHELDETHRSFMKAELGHAGWEDPGREAATLEPAESMGMPLTPALIADLRQIDLTTERPRADHVTVVSTRRDAETMALKAALADRAGHRWIDADGGDSWNCDAALNAAIVPMDIIREITASIQEANP